jgi:hypothetical protein
MAFNRVKQIILRAGIVLLLVAVFFQFEQVPFDDILYGAEPLTSDVAPLRYKIPSPPPPLKESPPTEITDVQPVPEQQAVSSENSLPFDPPVLAQPTPTVEPSADKVQPPQSGAGDKQKGERKSGAGDKQQQQKEERKSAMSAPKPGSDSKSELFSPKASVIFGSSKKILDIESDIKSSTAEMITIVLTGLFPPEAQVIEGKTPKIICDFPDVLMEKTIKRVIAINGRYILQVRTGIHPPPEPKSRVVIDLAPNRDYEVEQLFYEQNNRYSMIIREKS